MTAIAEVVSINVSEKKGVVKLPICEAEVNERGIVGDAHSGAWHRQVSLLSSKSIDRFGRMSERAFRYGEFAENLTTRGVDLSAVAILDRIVVGDVELEVTQIGKQCHGDGCSIFRSVGKCVMPTEGLFARVRRSGTIHVGDPVIHHPRPLRVHVITLSDRACMGEYEDHSGPAIQQALEAHLRETRWHLETTRLILPDDSAALKHVVSALIASQIDVILTTGGTGIGPRDITPDTIAPLLDKTIPGIMEFIRMKHGNRLPSALLSRSVAGVAGQTLVYTLPGSVKAVAEYLEVILPALQHSLLMLHAIDAH